MSEIAVPTLILHAKDDGLVSYEHAEFANRNITHSKLLPFETGGHGLLTQMSSVRKDVKAFLADV
jgi:pimeloyl-ACP methyl ester carboxylesterase